MPARSEKQRRFLNWKFGHRWVREHHFDNKGKLPASARQGAIRDELKKKKRPGR